ncbi:ThiF family adenylyltransferase [Leifsonia sp. 2MCAF36]|uniref:ThiF family adenylyltransferase n=1 Tax=Leifsonia sp. 2MCAF36 TaxID=3232988 RepID=UPI003F9C4EE8
MSTPLESPDLQRLLADGYEVSVRDGHLIIEHVPFLDVEGCRQYGVLISELNVTGDRTDRPAPHTVVFTGVPHDATKTPMARLIANSEPQPPVAGFAPLSLLSTKPASGSYENYYDKITQYVRAISGPARAADPTATARTYKPVPVSDDVSPFVYLDSASARAGVSDISKRLAVGPIAIIGLGGTGSYILDLVAKTPVPRIHLWDPDVLLAHNAFRAPGAATIDQLNARMTKVDYYTQQYGAMHRGIEPHAATLDASNVDQLAGVDFVFIAIDTGPGKRVIVDWLVAHGIPFIDVGMGIRRQGDTLGGIVRTTTVTPDHADHVAKRISFADEQEDEYDRNIQIADLNALNATLAVLKWKRMRGFYREHPDERQTTFTIAPNQLTNSDVVE